MSINRIRTRFAPSPTGKMHVGNLRTALYAFLIAKHEDGEFLLRIEDTDQERYVEGATEIIYHTLVQTGLVHDEGPDKDRGFGPYVQSERQAAGIYMEYAKRLVDSGKAYYCFCSKERLDSLREVAENSNNAFRYDKHCLHLSDEEVKQKLGEGTPFVIRQNNPETGNTSFSDVIYGTITVDNSELDDMILIKSDGFPTYNFANVVDDHLMKITHVVRGNEYLASTPKYNRLYEAFGWEVPVYVHCPLITNEEHQKLSKRSGHSSFEDLLELGFLTEAIVNFTALLGWSPGTDNEIFSLEELIKNFNYSNMSKSPAVFDMKKLRWMNGEYIKNMDTAEFYKIALPYFNSVINGTEATACINSEKVSELIQSRIEVLTDIPELIAFFYDLPDYEIALFNHKKMKTNAENSLELLKKELEILVSHEPWTKDSLHDTLMPLAEKWGVKNGQLLWPLRTALSGLPTSPGGAFELAEILGKKESIRRMEIGINKLIDQGAGSLSYE